MGKPSTLKEANQEAPTLDSEHDDGSDAPKTVCSEGTHKTPSCEPFLPGVHSERKEQEDVVETQEQVAVACMEGAHHHRDELDEEVCRDSGEAVFEKLLNEVSSEDKTISREAPSVRMRQEESRSCSSEEVEKVLENRDGPTESSPRRNDETPTNPPLAHPSTGNQKSPASLSERQKESSSSGSADEVFENADDIAKNSCGGKPMPSSSTPLSLTIRNDKIGSPLERQKESRFSGSADVKKVLGNTDGIVRRSYGGKPMLTSFTPSSPAKRNNNIGPPSVANHTPSLWENKTKKKFSGGPTIAKQTPFSSRIFFGLLLLSAVYPATASYESGCSVAGSSRTDNVLDGQDVIDGTDEFSHTFDQPARGYEKVCINAFHDVCVKHVILHDNSLQSLPESMFDHTDCLETVSFGGSNFTKFPSALNSSSDVRYLNLSYSKITHIERGSMNGMTGLITLNLAANQNMKKFPEDAFTLMHYSLKRVEMQMTQVQHPLVPAPQDVVCTYDHPCIVTHDIDGVTLSHIGNLVTVEISKNEVMTCEEVKLKLVDEYEVLNGSVICMNGMLDGTVTLVRKDRSDETTYVLTEGDLSTTVVPTTDKQSGMVESNVTTTQEPDSGTGVSIGWIFASLVAGIIIGILIGICIGAGATYCYVKVLSKKTVKTTTVDQKNSFYLNGVVIKETSV